VSDAPAVGLPGQPGEAGRVAVVALVASAGGLTALSRVLAGLPAGLPAAVLVAQHVDPRGPSALSEILAGRTSLALRAAADGDRLQPGTVLVTPAGSHLLVTSAGTVALVDTDELPPARPSADLLLATLAVTVGSGAVAVVLTGYGHDGQVGVRAVHRCGGRVLAQDEASAEHFGMPGAAIATGVVDRVVALDALPGVIAAEVAALRVPG
jgi:two-component system chemotaxis response regulator CheB